VNELLSAESSTSWEHIAPHLDAALSELGGTDRDVVLLRYFEKKTEIQKYELKFMKSAGLRLTATPNTHIVAVTITLTKEVV
jgi:hypothetical protein